MEIFVKCFKPRASRSPKKRNGKEEEHYGNYENNARIHEWQFHCLLVRYEVCVVLFGVWPCVWPCVQWDRQGATSLHDREFPLAPLSPAWKPAWPAGSASQRSKFEKSVFGCVIIINASGRTEPNEKIKNGSSSLWLVEMTPTVSHL